MNFDPKGGTDVSADNTITTVNGKIDPLPTTTKEGSTFDGWYAMNADQIEEKVETIDIAGAPLQFDTVYAKWTEVPTTSVDKPSSYVHYYAVNLSQLGSGTIAPSGDMNSQFWGKEYENHSFTFTPSAGSKISYVLIDGVNMGAIPSYTFDSISADHSIYVVFTTGGHANPSTCALD